MNVEAANQIYSQEYRFPTEGIIPPTKAFMMRADSFSQEGKASAWKPWAIRAGGVVGAGLTGVFAYKWLLAYVSVPLSLIGAAATLPISYKLHHWLGNKFLGSK